MLLLLFLLRQWVPAAVHVDLQNISHSQVHCLQSVPAKKHFHLKTKETDFNTLTTLPSAEAYLCHKEAGEKEKENTQGTLGESWEGMLKSTQEHT